MAELEYRAYRCCMCPQKNDMRTVCPAGPLKPEVSKCDFVCMFEDERGWRYSVQRRILDPRQYKAHVRRLHRDGKWGPWRDLSCFEWQDSFDRAQEVLNAHAAAKGWKAVRP
jgi:hypothetical protein